MRRSPANILFHELIGLPVKVVFHADPSMRGLSGLVVDETAETLILDTGRGRVRVSKRSGLFLFTLSRTPVLVRGEELLGDPPERLKKLDKARGVGRVRGRSKECRYSWCKTT